jgi:hypothetical protein
MAPMHFRTDEETLSAALASLGGIERESARVLVIDNTLDLSSIEFSAALLEEARAASHISIEDGESQMQFIDGKLTGRCGR